MGQCFARTFGGLCINIYIPKYNLLPSPQPEDSPTVVKESLEVISEEVEFAEFVEEKRLMKSREIIEMIERGTLPVEKRHPDNPATDLH